MLIFKIVIQLYSSQYKPCNETNAYNFTLKKNVFIEMRKLDCLI